MSDLEFSKIPIIDKPGVYPTQSFDGQSDQSYGFLPTYKVQTGDTRGDLTVKGLIRVVDNDGTIRLIMGYRKSAF